MFEHRDIWQAIDSLAKKNGYSSSGLAKKAGLDPTSFNKSKRLSANGKPRWPSTESLSKILAVTGTTMIEFTAIIVNDETAESPSGEDSQTNKNSVPLITTTKINKHNNFDSDGLPQGKHWNAYVLPKMVSRDDKALFALEVATDRMEPLYRQGDILLVSKDVSIKKGDRVLVSTVQNEIIIKELRRNTGDRLELTALSSHFDDYNLSVNDIDWMARIIWASQ